MRTHTTNGGDVFLQNYLIAQNPWMKSAYKPNWHPHRKPKPDNLRPLAIMFTALAIVSASVAVGAYLTR